MYRLYTSKLLLLYSSRNKKRLGLKCYFIMWRIKIKMRFTTEEWKFLEYCYLLRSQAGSNNRIVCQTLIVCRITLRHKAPPFLKTRCPYPRTLDSPPYWNFDSGSDCWHPSHRLTLHATLADLDGTIHPLPAQVPCLPHLLHRHRHSGHQAVKFLFQDVYFLPTSH